MIKPAAVVTGSSSGIGRSLAVNLSDKYYIYLVSRNKEKLNKTSELIKAKNNESEVIIADITNEKDVDRIASTVKPSKLELLINNQKEVYGML